MGEGGAAITEEEIETVSESGELKNKVLIVEVSVPMDFSRSWFASLVLASARDGRESVRRMR